ISWGQSATIRGETDWFSILTGWLITSFSHANITSRNGCTPGVPTPYMILCLELSVDPDVDLVFMEYTLNDGRDPGNRLIGNQLVMDTERLVRRVMALPNHPAVVLMQVPTHGIACYPPDIHPGNHGHKVMADLAVHLLQRVALGLLMEPYDSQDRELLREPLPPPMYPGNLPPSSPMCRVGEELRSLLVLAEGFEWVNEGTAVKPKPGYVATRPGARLQLRLDTNRSAVGSAADEKVHLYVHHLRSYQHMGSAQLSCASGCSCAEVVVDAHITDRVSQVYMAELVASQSKECVVEVQVLKETKSSEHKFKVSGVVVAERAGKENAMNRMGGHNQAFGLRQHTGDEVMVLGTGTLTKSLTVTAGAFSASAKAAIEGAGGKADLAAPKAAWTRRAYKKLVAELAEKGLDYKKEMLKKRVANLKSKGMFTERAAKAPVAAKAFPKKK
ncbi:hypothetical protein TSOC_013069, partial [Tetrabaena socialis]